MYNGFKIPRPFRKRKIRAESARFEKLESEELSRHYPLTRIQARRNEAGRKATARSRKTWKQDRDGCRRGGRRETLRRLAAKRRIEEAVMMGGGCSNRIK